ncbi:MAG: flagellar basal body L-ring protein FlgH [bacterium]
MKNMMISKIKNNKYKNKIIFAVIMLISLSFVLSGCSGNITPPKSMIPPTYVKPTAKNSIIHKKIAGSLWTGTSGGSNLFTDNTAFTLNDIVTIIVNDQTQAQDTSGTTLSKNSSGQGSFSFGSSTSKPTGYQGSNVESFNGGGGVAESGQIYTTIEAQVVKVYPNGNLELKGERKVSMNRETRYILIKGIVRPIDISPGNTVLSSQIANEKIWINGEGPVNWQQSPGWLYRILNFLWPF